MTASELARGEEPVLREPTFVDVLHARRVIEPYLGRTAFHESISLGTMLGLTLYIKYENHQPIGSFKVRGTLNKVLSLSDEERAAGVVTASMGNHGQRSATRRACSAFGQRW